jgi:hypothetical protein
MKTHCCCIITQNDGLIDDVIGIVGKDEKGIVLAAEHQFKETAKKIFNMQGYKGKKFEDVFDDEDIQDALDNGYLEVTSSRTVSITWPELRELEG